MSAHPIRWFFPFAVTILLVPPGCSYKRTTLGTEVEVLSRQEGGWSPVQTWGRLDVDQEVTGDMLLVRVHTLDLCQRDVRVEEQEVRTVNVDRSLSPAWPWVSAGALLGGFVALASVSEANGVNEDGSTNYDCTDDSICNAGSGVILVGLAGLLVWPFLDGAMKDSHPVEERGDPRSRTVPEDAACGDPLPLAFAVGSLRDGERVAATFVTDLRGEARVDLGRAFGRETPDGATVVVAAGGSREEEAVQPAAAWKKGAPASGSKGGKK